MRRKYKSTASVQVTEIPPPAMDLPKIPHGGKIIDNYELATDVDDENVYEKVQP